MMSKFSFVSTLNFLTVIFFVLFVFFVFIGTYVFSKDQKSKKSLLFLLLSFSFAFICIGQTFFTWSIFKEDAYFFNSVSSIGFCTFWPIIINFFLLLNNEKREINKKWKIFLIISYIIAFAFVVTAFLGINASKDYIRDGFSWIDIRGNSPTYDYFYVPIVMPTWIVVMFYIIINIKRKAKKTGDIMKKKQFGIILFWSIPAVFFAVFVNIIASSIGIKIISIGFLALGVWILAIGYAITKYKFLVPTLEYASKEIFKIGREINIVTDMGLNITEVNDIFFEKLGYSKEKVKSFNFNDLLFKKEACININVLNEEKVNEREISLRKKNGERIYTNLKASFIYNNGIKIGMLLVLSDITQLKTQNKILDEKVKEKTKELNALNEMLKKQLDINRVYAGVTVDNFIKEGIDPREIKPEKKEICILFSDIRNFSKISNTFSEEETLRLLNSVFGITDPSIDGNKGVIDNRQGDSVIARFENPIDSLRAAIEMRRGMIKLNQERVVSTRLDMGIGIHFGDVQMGNIGSTYKLNYTVIGDSVNCASRLEALTKHYGVSVIVSGELIDRVSDIYQSRYLDEIILPGRNNLIRLYEIYDHEREDVIEMKNKSKDLMFEANYHRKNGNFKEALKIYNALKKEVGPHKYDTERNISADPFIDFNISICEGLERDQFFDNFYFLEGICYYKK